MATYYNSYFLPACLPVAGIAVEAERTSIYNYNGASADAYCCLWWTLAGKSVSHFNSHFGALASLRFFQGHSLTLSLTHSLVRSLARSLSRLVE